VIFSLVYWALRRVLELVLLGLRPERSKELEIVLLRHELQVLRLWGAKTRSGFGTRRSSALPRSIVVCSAGDPWTARKRWFRAASRGSDTRRQRPRSNKGTPHPEIRALSVSYSRMRAPRRSRRSTEHGNGTVRRFRSRTPPPLASTKQGRLIGAWPGFAREPSPESSFRTLRAAVSIAQSSTPLPTPLPTPPTSENATT
jgi:hypothetical protein